MERWFVYLLGLLDRLKDEAAAEALERLAVPPRVRKRVMAARVHCREVLAEFYREPDLPASRVYDLLQPLDIEQVVLMMAKARKESAKRYISLYLTHLREVRITVTGEDLKRMGVPRTAVQTAPGRPARCEAGRRRAHCRGGACLRAALGGEGLTAVSR